jgi:hypothetical protein
MRNQDRLQGRQLLRQLPLGSDLEHPYRIRQPLEAHHPSVDSYESLGLSCQVEDSL